MDKNDINGIKIFELVAEGSIQMREIVDAWIDYIASGLVGLVHIFSPDIIIIGGGVSTQEDLFVNKLRNKILNSVMPAFRKEIRIEAAALGNTAGLVGAVYYCRNYS